MVAAERCSEVLCVVGFSETINVFKYLKSGYLCRLGMILHQELSECRSDAETCGQRFEIRE